MSGQRGTGHFIAMRATSAVLAALSLWFVIAAALSLPDTGYGSAMAFLTQPLNAVLVLVFALVSLYHMSLGMADIIADYIHKPSTKAALDLLNTLVPLALGGLAIYAVWRLNFGA